MDWKKYFKILLITNAIIFLVFFLTALGESVQEAFVSAFLITLIIALVSAPLLFLWMIFSTRIDTPAIRLIALVFFLRNPGHADHRFRCMPTTDSGACRPPIPTYADHLRSAFSRTR